MLPGLGILMVSMHAKVDYVAEALKVGALGYLNKDAATDNLLSGLRAVELWRLDDGQDSCPEHLLAQASEQQQDAP